MRRTAFAFALAGMSVIPGGSFEPLYATKHAERVSVSRFALDREPVVIALSSRSSSDTTRLGRQKGRRQSGVEDGTLTV